MPLAMATEADLAALTAVVEHPSLRDEFEQWQGRVASAWEDSFHPRELTWIERDAGQPVGFALAYVLPSSAAPFAIVRLGVVDSFRRRGIGARLLVTALAALRVRAPECREVSINAWLPNEAAAALGARYGFQHARYFWMMERPRGPAPEVRMPAGIELRTFDGSERALTDWNDAYNDSFARHYHFVRTTTENARSLAARSGFRNDGLGLAYRDGMCVGFCRNELFAERGEIGVLGTVTAARRVGLGRALLRWGIAWLEAQNAPRITLLVDGENDHALGLYRAEGFEVARTRQVWSRATHD